MEQGGNKAQEYRQEAEELRIRADNTSNPITRKTLLKLAEEYERMADSPVDDRPKKIIRIRLTNRSFPD